MWTRKLAERYDQTTFAHVMRCLEPLGLVIAAVGIVFALYQLALSREEMRLNRSVAEATLREIAESSEMRELTRRELQEGRISRQANLLGLTLERVQAAREWDRRPNQDGKVPERAATYMVERRMCVHHLGTQFVARAGQIPLLETMVNFGIPLQDIDLSNVNLVVLRYNETCEPPGINLAGAQMISTNLSNSNLWCAAFNDAVLTKATFNHACLRNANFTGAALDNVQFFSSDLHGAKFNNACLSGANLAWANLEDADFSGADFRGLSLNQVDLSGALNITQDQLDQSCSHRDAHGLPPGLNIPVEKPCPRKPECPKPK